MKTAPARCQREGKWEQELASLGCKDLSPSKPQEEPPHLAEGLPPYSSELRPWRASRGSGKRKTLVKMCSHTL